MTTIDATAATLETVTRFENGFNKRDLDAIMADMTEDTVFEHIAPSGSSFGRYEGADAVRAAWESMDVHFPGYDLRLVDIFAAGDRCASQWEMTWTDAEGVTHVARGANIFTMRDGKIASKMTYVSL